jgi:hypothetical protein
MMNEDAYILVGSEDLSREFNEVASFYSDYHKEVYGFRPRNMALCACDYPDQQALVEAMSHLKRLVDGLVAYAPTVFAQEELETKHAIDDFEAYVSQCIQVGAGNRANAIAWICESYNVDNANHTYGWEHLEYQVGIPFGYIQKSLKEAA